MPALCDTLWKQLNDTWRSYFVARSPPALLGECRPVCASRRWRRLGGPLLINGPVCGVPGCDGDDDEE